MRRTGGIAPAASFSVAPRTVSGADLFALGAIQPIRNERSATSLSTGAAVGGTSRAAYGRLMKQFVAALIMLLMRGFLLWLVVPTAALAGVVVKPYRRMMRRPVKIGQLIGWADLNLVASLERGVLRSLFPDPHPFVPWAEVAQVTHRVNLLDPA